MGDQVSFDSSSKPTNQPRLTWVGAGDTCVSKNWYVSVFEGPGSVEDEEHDDGDDEDDGEVAILPLLARTTAASSLLQTWNFTIISTEMYSCHIFKSYIQSKEQSRLTMTKRTFITVLPSFLG